MLLLELHEPAETNVAGSIMPGPKPAQVVVALQLQVYQEFIVMCVESAQQGNTRIRQTRYSCSDVWA